jgi:hypothetical protein
MSKWNNSDRIFIRIRKTDEQVFGVDGGALDLDSADCRQA